MTVRNIEGKKPYTGGTAIDIDENKVISLKLRDDDNLIIYDNGDNEIYVDLQLDSDIEPTDTLPVGVNTGRVTVANGWSVAGTLLSAKTTSGDNIKILYGDDNKLYVDNGTGTFKQVYLKAEVDQLLNQIRGLINGLDTRVTNLEGVAIRVSSTAPADAVQGTVWYDTTNDELKTYDGINWNTSGGGGGATYTAGNGINIDQNNEISVDTTVVATQQDLSLKQDTLTAGNGIDITSDVISYTGVAVGSLAPVTPYQGQLWYDTANAELKLYDGTQWVEIGGSTPPTPVETYQEVEWIASSGTQYIDTGVEFKSNTILQATVRADGSGTNNALFGTDYTNWDWSNPMCMYGASVIEAGSGGNSVPSSIGTNTKFDIELSTSSISYNGTATTYSGGFSGTHNITIFKSNGNQGSVTLRAFKIYEGVTLVRDFIPCYKTSNNEIGLYDKVNDVFYANDGTGVFTKGPDKLPEYPDLDEFTLTDTISNGLSSCHGIACARDASYLIEGNASSFTCTYALSNGELSSFTGTRASSAGIDTRGLWIKSDGTKLVSLTDGSPYAYISVMSTPYDLSTASTTTCSIPSNSAPCGPEFSPDGTKFFCCERDSSDIHAYTCSTPFDLTTLTHIASKDISGVVQQPAQVRFSPTGLKMYVSDRSYRSSVHGIYQYNLSTPWDITTATYVNKSLATDIECVIDFANNGTRLFVSEATTSTLRQYDI